MPNPTSAEKVFNAMGALVLCPECLEYKPKLMRFRFVLCELLPAYCNGTTQQDACSYFCAKAIVFRLHPKARVKYIGADDIGK